MNYNNKLKKIGFKVIIFREKKYPKMLNYIKQQYKIYYDKSMIAISNGINEYENLPYEEKAVVDFIMSIIF
jgi:ribonucleotide reductase beta subunit family protein with ferritin-like domain